VRISGGLWLLWGAQVRITVFAEEQYYFFCRVDPVDKSSWVLACVYGDASYRNNPGIRRDVQGLIDMRWNVCCTGDFNAITNEIGKFGGSM
jgi:hypothetical protein